MGQAAVDLPDSLDSTPAPPGSADDLLSQLAGQEIDRLLAESDSKPAPMPAEPAPPAFDDSAEAVEKLLEPAKIEAELTNVPASAAATDDAYQSQIDELFKQLNVGTEPKAPEPVAPPASAAPATAAAQKNAPSPAEPDQSTTAAERAALNPPAESAPQLEMVIQDLPRQSHPVYVRVLEIVNRPFSACPDRLRDTLGKVAILTLMNSLAVLLYIMIFKR